MRLVINKKFLFILLLIILQFYWSSESIAAIAAPDENPYGTWHSDFNRNQSRILLLKSIEEDEVISRILSGDPIFGTLYSNDLDGRWGKTQGIYQKATSVPTNRTAEALVAKAKAFVYLMGLSESLIALNDSLSDVFKQGAINLLNGFDEGVGGSSQVNQLITRAKELICYLEAFDMLRSIGDPEDWQENVARKLCRYASNIYNSADVYSSLLARNNHRIIVGSALGMAAILLGEWGSTLPTITREMPQAWIGYAMTEINSTLFQHTVHHVFPDGGYNEGPHYLRFAMAFALPFFKAMKNLGEIFGHGNPPGDWIEPYYTTGGDPYDIRTHWYGRVGDAKPDLYSVLEWIAKIRQPEGRLPALADTYFDSYFPEAAIVGGQYFWPIESFIPSLQSENFINWSLQDFMENRPDFIIAGNLPQESPTEWDKMQVFAETGDIVFRSGWDLNDVYFHLYAKDYVWGWLDASRNGHLHDDNSSFILGYNGQVLALDCGYISWNRRDEVEGPENHNLILVGLYGPSKTNTKAQILQTINEDFYKFVKINTNYLGTTIRRNVLFCNEKYFIINDHISNSSSNTYRFVLHGNDPSAQEINNGAVWQIEDGKLKSKVTSIGTGLNTEYVIEEHDFGYNHTREHKVLIVGKNATSTQFLSIHFPFDANLSSDPEIVDASGSDINGFQYAGFYVDRTAEISFGNRYEFVLSQWPYSNDLNITGASYGESNRIIEYIETDAELLVMSFNVDNPDDPNLIEVFNRNMTYLNYGGLPLFPNQPPQLNSVGDQTMNEGEILEVPISATDPNGDYISFSDNNMPLFGQLIDNGDGTGMIRFTADYSHEGDYYNIEVTAGDDESPQLTDLVSFDLHVEHINQTPVAKLLADNDQGLAPLTINFDASTSYDPPEDPAGSIEGYSWDFGDGTYSDSETDQHTYNIVGKYHVTLTVMDNEGAIASEDTLIINNAELGKIYISEVADDRPNEKAFLELYNNADYAIDLTGFKLLEFNDTAGEEIFDFGSDEGDNLGPSSTILPAKGLMVVAGGISLSDFLDEWSMGALPLNANFNVGNSDLNFHLSKRWELRYFDGNENMRDGSLIDDTQELVGGENKRDFQVSRGNWRYDEDIPGTPGELEHGDQSLPIALVSLNVSVENNNVILRWTTRSEVNNLGFIVQRSLYKDSLYTIIASYATDENLQGLGSSANGKEYTFTDKDITPSFTYWYELIDVSSTGLKTKHGPVAGEITWNDSHLTPVYSDQIPETHALYNNYPNPFNSSCNIYFDIPESISNSSRVNITIYDILGRKIRELYQGYVPAGRYQVIWDGKNQWGDAVPSGVFIYMMRTPEFNHSKKMVVLR